MRKLHSASLIASLVLSANVYAAPVTFNFEGVIDYIGAGSDFEAAGAAVSDAFTGSYTFESTTPGTPGFWPWITGYNMGAGDFSMSLNIGTGTFDSDPAVGGTITTYNAIGVFEEYRVNSYLPDGSLIDLVMGASGNLHATLPTDTLPDYSVWNEILITNSFGQSFGGMLTAMSIDNSSTGTSNPTPPPTTGTTVSEPSTYLLLSLGILAAPMLRRRKKRG